MSSLVREAEAARSLGKWAREYTRRPCTSTDWRCEIQDAPDRDSWTVQAALSLRAVTRVSDVRVQISEQCASLSTNLARRIHALLTFESCSQASDVPGIDQSTTGGLFNPLRAGQGAKVVSS